MLKINPKDFPQRIDTAEFTKEVTKLESDVFIIGNTEEQDFSFHINYLSDLYEINGDIFEGSYVINMNFTDGASGSPLC